MLIHMVQLTDLLLRASCFFLQSFLSSVALTHSNYLFMYASCSHVRHITLAYS